MSLARLNCRGEVISLKDRGQGRIGRDDLAPTKIQFKIYVQASVKSKFKKSLRPLRLGGEKLVMMITKIQS